MWIGQKRWQLVSTDTAGVPHGGPYGNVRTFEREASKLGFYLGWSRRMGCFSILTKSGPKWTFQMHLQNTDGPIPLTTQLLALLAYVRRQHGRQRHVHVKSYLANLERDRQKRIVDERYEQLREPALDAAIESRRARGADTRPLISIPARSVGRG